MAKTTFDSLIKRAGGGGPSQAQLEANALLQKYQREFGQQQGRRFFAGNVPFDEARKKIKERSGKR